MASYKNAVYITKKLMGAFQLKDFQAVGFAANFMQESGCEPWKYMKAEKAGTFKGSAANGAGYGAGLAQWSNGWKKKLQNYFNRQTPIETWTMDEQLDIIIKCCVKGFINLLRNCSNAAESTDIVLRGYENGSGGYGTSLRSKQSMNAYTWAKSVYMPDGKRMTFSCGYEGLITSRVAYAKIILQQMGNFSAAELASVGNLSGGEFSGGGEGGGGFTPPTPEDIQKAIYQYLHAYPVHSEYLTYSGSGGNIFTNAKDNAFTAAALAENRKETSILMLSSKNAKHTRIYSTNDSCIVLDELKFKVDFDETWANEKITQADVDARYAQLKKQEAEAKKKQEEEKKKAEEEKKKAEAEAAKNSSTGDDNSKDKDNKDKGKGKGKNSSNGK